MPVVGHQAESQQASGNALLRLGEQLDEGGVVAILVKQAAAPVAAVEHVVNESPGRVTGHSRHEAIVAGKGRDVKYR